MDRESVEWAAMRLRHAFVPALLVLTVAGAGPAWAEPRWGEARAICGRLRAEGWRAESPVGGAPVADVTVGGSTAIQLCKVARALPATGGGRAPTLDVFLQHRGGDAASLGASYWHAGDRVATLAAAADAAARLARELGMPLAAGARAAILAGDSFEAAERGVTTKVSIETREGERISQPDLAPEAIPLLRLNVSFAPVD
jgi:hypothetical protein